MLVRTTKSMNILAFPISKEGFLFAYEIWTDVFLQLYHPRLTLLSVSYLLRVKGGNCYRKIMNSYHILGY